MPARLNIAAASRSLTIRTRPAVCAQQTPFVCRAIQAPRRWLSQEPTTSASQSSGSGGIEDAGLPGSIEGGAQLTNALALKQLQSVAQGEPTELFHKFPLPELPIPPRQMQKHRYDPVVKQVMGLIMKDGKAKAAQRNMAYILNHLRTASPPNVNPAKPLIPTAPPANELPLDPVLYLTVAIDTIAPLVKVRQLRGAAGGGQSLPIPEPLGQRQRRRVAIKWILDSATKKASRGSGRFMFAQKFADEVVAVVEGRSSAWDRRLLIHKAGTSARANVNFGSRKTRRW